MNLPTKSELIALKADLEAIRPKFEVKHRSPDNNAAWFALNRACNLLADVIRVYDDLETFKRVLWMLVGDKVHQVASDAMISTLNGEMT